MYAPYLFFFLFVASGFGGGLLLFARWMERQGGPETLPSDRGEEAGLTPRGPHDAFGVRDEISVHARWTSVRRGSGPSARVVSVTRYRALLDPPLRMGLELGHEGLLERAGTVGAREVRFGDPELDRALRVRAIDGAHAETVLRDPEVKQALLRALEHGAIAVSDGRVVAGHDGWAESSGAVCEGIDLVHGVARAFLAARARARAAWEVTLDHAWGEIARADAMEWQPERSRILARAGHATLALEVVPEGGELVTQMELRFDAPLGVGLAIHRCDGEHPPLDVGPPGDVAPDVRSGDVAQEVRSGDGAFDALFTATAREPATAGRVLAAGGAEAIVRLAARMPELEVSDRGATARAGELLSDPRAAGEVMRAATDLARALRGEGTTGRTGAYR